jgi:hypothetical protein
MGNFVKHLLILLISILLLSSPLFGQSTQKYESVGQCVLQTMTEKKLTGNQMFKLVKDECERILGNGKVGISKSQENVLFICKLNNITDDESLQLIFSRFGTIMSCNVVKDGRTGQSLQYAFIEFERQDSCEEAYMKMNNVLIDDRRIKVDFSQSIAKEWNKWSGQW